MNFSKILKEKKINSTLIKQENSFLKKNNFLWLIKISDDKVLKDLLPGLTELGCNFVVVSDLDLKRTKNIVIKKECLDEKVIGFDFIICDNECEWLDFYFEKWITPIIFKENYLSSLLNEFDPIKNEWNCFIFERYNQWSIFYALIRYLENSKFSFDNKNLIRNVLKIK